MRDFQVLQNLIGEWSLKKFNSNNPRGTIKHMEEEVQHLLDAPYDIENIADLFILLIETSRRAGFDMDEVYQAIEAKYKINLSRIWLNPDEHGVTRHRK